MTRSNPDLDLSTANRGLPPDVNGSALPDAAVAAAAANGPLAGTESVGGTAARGAAWTVFGFGAKLAFRFAFNLILTRLVAPKVFGVMALVTLMVQALHMFSDLGISQCAVRHPRGDDPKFLNTAWTLQAARGLLLWLFSWALALPAAWFYEEPALAWLVPLAGATALLDGFTATAVITLNRRLARKALVLLEVGVYVAVTAVTVAVIGYLGHRQPDALLDPRVQDDQTFALVVGMVATSLLYMVGTYRLARTHAHHFHYDRAAGRDLLHFGGWVFVSTACTFLAGQADRLVIGKLSLEVLGVYQLASQLAALPAQLLATLGAQLIFPLYSQLFHDRGNPQPAVAGVHRTLGLLAGVLASGLIAAGPNLVETLYPGRYQDAGRYVQLLAATAWFTMLLCSGEAILLARGQTKLLAAGQVAKLVVLPLLLTVGYRQGGLIGLVIGYGAAEVLRYTLIAASVRRLGLLRDDLWLTLLVAGSAALAEGLVSIVGDGWSSWGRLGCEAAVVTLIWGAVAAMLYRKGLIGLTTR